MSEHDSRPKKDTGFRPQASARAQMSDVADLFLALFKATGFRPQASARARARAQMSDVAGVFLALLLAFSFSFWLKPVA